MSPTSTLQPFAQFYRMPQATHNTSGNIHSAMFALKGQHPQVPKLTILSSSAPRERTSFTISQYDADDESDGSDKDLPSYPNSSSSTLSLSSTSSATHPPNAYGRKKPQAPAQTQPRTRAESDSSQRHRRHSVGYESACSLPPVPESSPLITRDDSHGSTGSQSSHGRLRRNFAFTNIQSMRL